MHATRRLKLMDKCILQREETGPNVVQGKETPTKHWALAVGF